MSPHLFFGFASPPICVVAVGRPKSGSGVAAGAVAGAGTLQEWGAHKALSVGSTSGQESAR